MRKLRLLIFSCGELGKQHIQLDSEYIRSKNVCAIAQVVGGLPGSSMAACWCAQCKVPVTRGMTRSIRWKGLSLRIPVQWVPLAEIKKIDDKMKHT